MKECYNHIEARADSSWFHPGRKPIQIKRKSIETGRKSTGNGRKSIETLKEINREWSEINRTLSHMIRKLKGNQSKGLTTPHTPQKQPQNMFFALILFSSCFILVSSWFHPFMLVAPWPQRSSLALPVSSWFHLGFHPGFIPSSWFHPGPASSAKLLKNSLSSLCCFSISSWCSSWWPATLG